MTATVHAIVGAAIAAHIQDPVATSVLSLTCHFVMDCIPHWDLGTNWRKRPKHVTGLISISDTLIGITLAYFLYGGKVSFLPLTLGIVFAVLPDWLETPWYIFFAHQNKHEPGPKAGIVEQLTYKVYRLENLFHAKAEFPFGLFTQLAALVFFLALVG